ncbi:MAG TPA: MBL fold metallo-hydrolase RNA specificity domain-containing protein [Candidatus Bilamarchaeaceae archaeon]|nr:MBL fold metallo-hydrolase RNA specificity domain-containing protein [Candidatus Bilamarchaeaceae archaeon]
MSFFTMYSTILKSFALLCSLGFYGDSIEITFYGGVQEVGRSSVFLNNNNKNLLLDCGIKLGEKTEYPLFEDEDLKKIQNIFITHAHLDHSGYLPHIYARGFHPNIYATKPTRDLLGVLLSDYRKIHKEEHFTQKHVDQVLQSIKIVEPQDGLQQPFNCNLYNAGHVLGSQMIKINESGGITYTGDICMRKTRVLDPCERNISSKTLIIENTYGSKDGIIPSFKESYSKLVNLINKTLKDGGFVLIPSFAVGRAQEILLALDDYMRSGQLQESKIYVEGMINKSMRIYRHNAIYANDDIKRRILMSEDDPFKSKYFHQSRSKDRKDVLSEPCIVVSTSGMLSGGPVLFYLQKLASDPKSTLIFAGYQGEGTLGKKILDGERLVQIDEQQIDIKMKVDNIRISGHADYNELLQFIKGVKGLEKVFLVHGENTSLKDELEKKYEVIIPSPRETFNV